ncbi:ABC transporter substrate-binding protein [Glycomyces algeriensis]|uniref:Sugar ABC transporter substrate-binding protein n=1 Tax=Glycomyces algeriensis TaxID=256037 RepID=A0A9W6GA02_9ACTN|nr:extracellular solute-binding protein [Glycomyces algeriensis]MDA1364242.1 extracellular solute-binding protein [Glycomyces algeriensis]MDR7350267.1 multiple sugar transport system substrate-binding protein [Glycomyces algeriensis]GLI42978.1 sugar ABC transporter substrate-binding protein [Glycomyces algeriensis]
MQRRLIFKGLGASAVALPGLAACGTGGGGDVELSDEPVTIRMTWWGADTRAELTDQAIAAFQKEHPNITVKGEFKDWAGYWDALATTTAANDSPDVIQMDELYLASYGDRGTLLDLADTSDFLDTSGFEAATLETGKIDGTQYAIPIGAGMLASVVNADLFAQYGVELPDDTTWTWDDYAAIANELTEKSGGVINGTGLTGGTDAGSIRYWARLHGNELYGENGDVTLDPAVLAALWEYSLALIESGGAETAAETVEGQSAGLEGSSIATGKIAMTIAYNTQITPLLAASGADLRLIQLPGAVETTANFIKPSMYWAVSSQSEHPAEAATLIDFLVNHEAAADILGTERGIPANPAMREHVATDLDEGEQLAVDYLESATVGPAVVVTPNGGSGFDPTCQRYSQEVLFGERTPQDAAEAFIEELKTEIDAAA